MADQVDSLAERKRELIARSESYRQSLQASLSDIKETTAWISRSVRTVRSVYPVLLLLMPLAGLIVRKKGLRKRLPPPKRGLLSKAAMGLKIFRTVKPFWDGFRQGQKSANGQR